MTTITARPLHADDAERWAALINAAEAVDKIGENVDAEDCAEELADPEVDLDRQSLLLLDGDTAVAAQVLIRRPGADGVLRVHSDGVVHPEHRRKGIGTRLLAAGREYVDAVGAELLMRAYDTNPGAIALAEAAGMRPTRFWFEFDRDLAEPVTPVPAPEGLTIRSLGPQFDAARWDEPLRLAHNAAFAEHWGSGPSTPQAWAHWKTGSRSFRPAGSAVATTADETVAGFVLSFEWEADTVRKGHRDLYVGDVGTLAEHRGRGLGAAMLAHVLAAGVAQGYARSSLTVDTQNPTGALGIYERAGYRARIRSTTYVAPVTP